LILCKERINFVNKILINGYLGGAKWTTSFSFPQSHPSGWILLVQSVKSFLLHSSLVKRKNRKMSILWHAAPLLSNSYVNRRQHNSCSYGTALWRAEETLFHAVRAGSI
jgi:hypothetical protein